MKIKAYFLNGRVEEHNTETHYSSSGLFGSSNVGVTNYTLLTDDLSDGLWIQFRYYDSGASLAREVSGKTGIGAQIVDGCFYPLFTAEELKEIAWIECDGKRILWRVRPDSDLVNGVKFEVQADIYISEDKEHSLKAQALSLYHTLHGDYGAEPFPKGIHEDEADWEKRIVEHIGLDLETMRYFLEMEKGEIEMEQNKEERVDRIAGNMPNVIGGEQPSANPFNLDDEPSSSAGTEDDLAEFTDDAGDELEDLLPPVGDDEDDDDYEGFTSF